MSKMITFDEEQRVFHLHNDKISYLFQVEKGDLLSHLYYGQRIHAYHGQRQYPYADRGFSGNLPGSLDRTYSPDSLLQEYTPNGIGDYRIPAVIVRQENGSRATRFKYSDYRIEAGKPALKGLPSTYVEDGDEVETLVVTLTDDVAHLELELRYSIFMGRAVIARSTRIINHAEAPVYLEKAASLQLDFAPRDFEVISLPGAHARERQMERTPLSRGVHSYESRRGTTSHQMSNFIALVNPTTTENTGDAYGISLIYSGNHAMQVERDQIQQTRVVAGINDYNFTWKLNPEDDFQSPEALVAYSPNGLNGMSNTLQHIARERIARGKWRDLERPILVNNWEATFMDFNEERLTPIVDDAKKLGIEMFVLDDGWFGHRDDDNSSLGDWFVDQKKFPHGIKHFVDYVHAQGLKFGLWFEPEMISFDSKLYEDHPDYLMQVPGRQPSPSRNQYILDITRPEVRDNIVAQVEKILRENDVDYVKWDMNRHLADVYSLGLAPDQEGEVYHRFVLGLYDMLERITTDLPDILFEGCSGGGGRIDYGMLAYMPQSWTSDCTDAYEREKIQYATSLFYPNSGFTAHVSVIPNQQTGRSVSFATRGAVAMSATFGYELDLTKLTAEEQEQVKEQVAEYKEIRPLVQFGDFYRLRSPYTTNGCGWMFVSPDKREVVVDTFHTQSSGQPCAHVTKLVGLDPQKQYEDLATHTVYGGDELMRMGLYDPLVHEDYTAKAYHFKARD